VSPLGCAPASLGSRKAILRECQHGNVLDGGHAGPVPSKLTQTAKEMGRVGKRPTPVVTTRCTLRCPHPFPKMVRNNSSLGYFSAMSHDAPPHTQQQQKDGRDDERDEACRPQGKKRKWDDGNGRRKQVGDEHPCGLHKRILLLRRCSLEFRCSLDLEKCLGVTSSASTIVVVS
jgi:hypothetical protein